MGEGCCAAQRGASPLTTKGLFTTEGLLTTKVLFTTKGLRGKRNRSAQETTQQRLVAPRFPVVSKLACAGLRSGPKARR